MNLDEGITRNAAETESCEGNDRSDTLVFSDEKAKDFKKLKVNYVRGAPPKITRETALILFSPSVCLSHRHYLNQLSGSLTSHCLSPAYRLST